MSIPAYPSIYAIGHKAIADIFTTEVVVEEKVDGSQFSFMWREDGSWVARSKGQELIDGNINKLFAPAVETFKQLLPKLIPNVIYRGEALCKPKHNTLEYGRIPTGGVILFDVEANGQNFLSPEEKREHIHSLGLEVVPVLYKGKIDDFEQFKRLLEMESYLGKCKIEGIVVKNYNLFTYDKKVMIGKFVSEAFKEKHNKDWKNSNPGSSDIIGNLIEIYRHENRWQKAVQHLQESGQLLGEPKDIGLLMKEISTDILKEEEDNIKEALFKWAWKKIIAGATRGFPEWYKENLAKSSLSN